MNKRVIRGYAAALSLLGLSTAYAATSSVPYPANQGGTATTIPVTDPRVAALNAREAQLRRRAVEVRRIVASRTAAAAAQPPVRIVTLPAVTQTRTS